MKQTTTEAELRALLAAGKSTKQIASETGWSPSTIYCALAVLGLRPQTPRATGSAMADRMQRAVRALERGNTLRQVAIVEGVTLCTLAQALKRNGLPTTPAKAMLAKINRLQAVSDIHTEICAERRELSAA